MLLLTDVFFSSNKHKIGFQNDKIHLHTIEYQYFTKNK